MKQTRVLHARANMIVRKFSSASLNTKLNKCCSCRAYCTPIYGCQPGCSLLNVSVLFNKLGVAYNDMLFDNCCKNHGDVVRQVFLHLMLCVCVFNYAQIVFFLILVLCDNSIVDAALVSDLCLCRRVLF